MTSFRRLRSLMRGRRLLAAGAFLFLGYVFANNLSPWPRYALRTEAKTGRELARTHRSPPPPRTVLNHVSDDGRQVIVGVYDGNNSWLELWDPRTGADLTPAHWRGAGWRQLLDDRLYGVGVERLLDNPAGRVFLQDAEVWTTHCGRLTSDPVGDGVRPRHPWERGPLPFNCIAVSPDGRLIARQPPHGPPGPIVTRALTGGPVVEEVDTGRRIATFPLGVGHLLLAPGGRSAISGRHLTRGDDVLYVPRSLIFEEDGVPRRRTDQPYLSLWDLDARRRRAELLLPNPPYHVEFSPDGRYVYATTWSNLMRLWDADTGRPVADIYTSPKPHFMAGGRLLVAPSDDQETLHIWETATGLPLVDWDLEPPPIGRIDGFTFSGDRYVLAGVDPDAVRPGKSGVKFLDRAEEWISERVSGERKWKDGHQVMVLDLVDRRTLGRARGLAGTVSPNGRWLATLDADGVVRVWELPLRRPWARGFGYAAAVFAGGWVVVGLRRRAARTG
jgi:WD40 repeat protein